MKVAVEQGEVCAIFVEHVIGFHVWMIDGHVGIASEGDAVECGGESEHALLHLGELKVGTEHLAVDVELLLFEFVGIVGEVPRGEGGGS